MENETKKTLVVTGFTPFSGYSVNASWEAVKLLPNLFKNHEKSSEINLHIEEIPVAYKEVVGRVGTLWERHRPFLVIHVGVHSALKDCIALESQARNFGYKFPDMYEEVLQEIDEEDRRILRTSCQLGEICTAINGNQSLNLKARVSDDAGSYLCEYTYYQSLSLQGSAQVLFIHVPDVSKSPSTETCQALFEVLIHLLQNLN